MLASAATAGVIRVPQDVSCIEAAIQYARAAATAAEEGAGGDMRGDTEGDTHRDSGSLYRLRATPRPGCAERQLGCWRR